MALANQSFGEWAEELAIAGGVGLVVGAIFFVILYAVIRVSPKRWWLWGAGAMTALLALMIMLCAGLHRAVVQQIYADGGGTGARRDPAHRP